MSKSIPSTTVHRSHGGDMLRSLIANQTSPLRLWQFLLRLWWAPSHPAHLQGPQLVCDTVEQVSRLECAPQNYLSRSRTSAAFWRRLTALWGFVCVFNECLVVMLVSLLCNTATEFDSHFDLDKEKENSDKTQIFSHCKEKQNLHI